MSEGVLHIDVLDTLFACRCTCQYDNDFSFLCAERGNLGIRFVSKAGRDEYCVAAFDTLVALPQRTLSPNEPVGG
jgi:hypothetical protein